MKFIIICALVMASFTLLAESEVILNFHKTGRRPTDKEIENIVSRFKVGDRAQSSQGPYKSLDKASREKADHLMSIAEVRREEARALRLSATEERLRDSPDNKLIEKLKAKALEKDGVVKKLDIEAKALMQNTAIDLKDFNRILSEKSLTQEERLQQLKITLKSQLDDGKVFYGMKRIKKAAGKSSILSLGILATGATGTFGLISIGDRSKNRLDNSDRINAKDKEPAVLLKTTKATNASEL
jgi:hypothetical protein